MCFLHAVDRNNDRTNKQTYLRDGKIKQLIQVYRVKFIIFIMNKWIKWDPWTEDSSMLFLVFLWSNVIIIIIHAVIIYLFHEVDTFQTSSSLLSMQSN